MITSLKLVARGLLFFLSIAIALYAITYLSAHPIGQFLQSKPTAQLRDSLWQTAFHLHVAGGAVALAIGPFQFLRSIQTRYPQTHRRLGILYILSIGMAGLAGFYLALFASTGLPARLGFSTLAVVWLFTTLRAYQWARRRNWTAHQAWMIRSFAITLAAVTLRIWLPLFLAGFHLPFATAYPIIAWLCWVPNAFVAEVLIRNKTR